MARPTDLTQEVHETVVAAIRKGAYPETAAALAGIDRATYYRWLKRGAKDKTGIYRSFCDDVKKALAEAEMGDLDKVGAAREWTASAWRLERRWSERWGKKIRQEVSGADGKPIPLAFVPWPEDQDIPTPDDDTED